MFSFIARHVIQAALSGAALAATPAFAEYRCAEPKSPLDERVCAIVKEQGPTALRQFIQRTQSIHHLSFYDYVSDRDFVRWAAEDRTDPDVVAWKQRARRTLREMENAVQ